VALEWVSKKVACDIRRTALAVPAADDGAAWRCGRTEADGPPHKLCRATQKTVRRGLGRKADFSYWQCYEGQIVLIKCPDQVA
jgi:hypothetical protein